MFDRNPSGKKINMKIERNEEIFWTCPFCALVCDGLPAPFSKDGLIENLPSCQKAEIGLKKTLTKSTKKDLAFGRKKFIKLPNAIEQIRSKLRKNERIFISGLGVDVAGAREVVKLACKFNAVVDHKYGDILSKVSKSIQNKGALFCSLSEVKKRADLLIFLGTIPNIRTPRLLDRIEKEGPGNSKKEKYIIGDASWSAEVMLLKLQKLSAFISTSDKQYLDDDLESLMKKIDGSKYTAIIWDPNFYGDCTEDIAILLVEIVKHLNAHYRVSILTLGGDEGSLTMQNVMVWMTGLPLRSKYTLGNLDYDPHRFTLSSLLKKKEIDTVVWISCFNDDLDDSLDLSEISLILIGHKNYGNKLDKIMSRTKELIYIPVATNGIGASGYLMRGDGVSIIPLRKVVTDGLMTVDSVIKELLGEKEEGYGDV